jgi:flagellin-like protein
MSKWWWIDTDRGWRGQSETIGVVLLAAIALVLVAAIGLFLFSDTGGDGQNELLLTDLDSELTATNVTISHAAGDTLDPEEVNVIVEGNTRTIPMDEFSGIDEEFSAGQTVS